MDFEEYKDNVISVYKLKEDIENWINFHDNDGRKTHDFLVYLWDVEFRIEELKKEILWFEECMLDYIKECKDK